MADQPSAIIAQDDLVLLRRVEPEDLDLYYNWYRNPEVQEYMSNPYWNPGKSLGEFRDLFTRKYLIQTSDRLAITICVRPDQRPVGQAMLFDIDRQDGRAEVGILIGRLSDRRRGLAIRSLKLILNYVAKDMNVRRVICHIMKDNLASEMLFRKAGFVEIGEKPGRPGLICFEYRIPDKSD